MLDYKSYIKSRQMRLKVLRLFDFIPDRLMLRMQYRIKFGRRLDLKNPKRFTEKIQYYKLYYRNANMPVCSDKYLVREYVKNKGFAEILNEVYGVYDDADKIDFNLLPNSFVIKNTLGGGGNDIIICKDKNSFDIESAKTQMRSWLNKKGKNPGREWVYDVGKPKILIEKYLEDKTHPGGLIDYKFFCFNGQVHYLYVIANRKLGEHAEFGIYDKDFNRLKYERAGEKPLSFDIEKPQNYDEMVRIAEILSNEFPHVRVDLYNIDGKIIFGELTFFGASGYMKFEPDEFDFILGEKFNICERGKKC
ncbi:MAG: carbonic anhydrase [Clostridiaceae bacterium]|nr:carbonic anhydrase [Clostridiaceae bacterium]